MELKQYDTINSVENPIEFNILDWDDQPTDAFVTVVGIGSKVYEKHNKKIERLQSLSAKRGKEPDQDELNELYVDMLVACTKAWKGFKEDGKDIPFEEDNVRDIYTRYPYIRNFVMKSVMDIRAFVKN